MKEENKEKAPNKKGGYFATKEFHDLYDYTKVYKKGDEIIGFSEDRLKKGIDNGLIEKA